MAEEKKTKPEGEKAAAKSKPADKRPTAKKPDAVKAVEKKAAQKKPAKKKSAAKTVAKKADGEAKAAKPTAGSKPKAVAKDDAKPKAEVKAPTKKTDGATKAKSDSASESKKESSAQSKAKAQAKMDEPVDAPLVVRARARYVRTAPRKARLVIDHIRGCKVDDARTILQFTQRHAARDVSKVLESAIANAEHNHELAADDLIVAAAYVDEGPTLKRWQPRARGRASQILKRTSHITVEVTEARVKNNSRKAAA